MANKKQQQISLHLKNGSGAQQEQQNLNGTVENSITRQFGPVRDDIKKLFIGGLNGETTERDLREHFSRFGKIKYIDVKVEAATGQSRGYAFIVFKTMEGLENALAYNNDHVINNKKIDLKKALPRHAKLFIGGLTAKLTEDDIKDYFKRYPSLVKVQIPYDEVKNRHKGFCFLTFDNIQAVTEILKFPKHVINGNQVDVKVPASKVNHYGMMPGASGPMRGMHGDIRRPEDFLRQSRYPPCAPGNCHEGYGYYILHTGYSPDYNYSYGYPCYIPSVVADYQNEGYAASAPSGVYVNQIVQ